MIQWHSRANKGDFTEMVREDIKDFDLPTDPEYYEKVDKEKFKAVIKEKSKTYALKNLKERQETHSKMSSLKYDDLSLQPYFKNHNISIETKRTVFKWRCHMEKFKCNYKNLYNDDLSCFLCKEHLDSQRMSIECKKIVGIDQWPKNSYDDLFKKDIPDAIITLIMKITKNREVLGLD